MPLLIIYIYKIIYKYQKIRLKKKFIYNNFF